MKNGVMRSRNELMNAATVVPETKCPNVMIKFKRTVARKYCKN
jgi:hypothetical protein